jgi:hypothetical protein
MNSTNEKKSFIFIQLTHKNARFGFEWNYANTLLP